MKIRNLSNLYRTLLDPIKSILTVTHYITFENKNTSSFRNDYCMYVLLEVTGAQYLIIGLKVDEKFLATFRSRIKNSRPI